MFSTIPNLLTPENLPLIILAFIWIIGAVFQDLKRREVDNIWNFTLITFALGYRLVISIYTDSYSFALNGFLGFIIFIIIANAFYYSRIFGGGDTKLLIALGPILPLSYDWIINLKIFTAFLILFLISGAIYVFIWALVLTALNFKKFKKEFIKQAKLNKKLFIIAIILSITLLLITIVMKQYLLITLPITIILTPLLLIFAKSVEEVCMIKLVSPKKATIGDWLQEDIKIGNKIIKAHWEGITPHQLKLIQTKCKKNIQIKYGIPFTPGFLIGLILLLIITEKHLFGF